MFFIENQDINFSLKIKYCNCVLQLHLQLSRISAQHFYLFILLVMTMRKSWKYFTKHCAILLLFFDKFDTLHANLRLMGNAIQYYNLLQTSQLSMDILFFSASCRHTCLRKKLFSCHSGCMPNITICHQYRAICIESNGSD